MSNFCVAQTEKLVSIVMPAFNAERTIADSISSVIDQSYANWELIVVDDGSSDDTDSILDSFSSDSRIRCAHTGSNGGPALARNVGIELAQGDFIAFLDSDDMWHKDKLKTQVAFMESTGAVISFTSYWRVDGSGVQIISKQAVPQVVNYNDMLDRNHIGCLTALYRRAELQDLRFFDPSDLPPRNWAIQKESLFS